MPKRLKAKGSNMEVSSSDRREEFQEAENEETQEVKGQKGVVKAREVTVRRRPW